MRKLATNEGTVRSENVTLPADAGILDQTQVYLALNTETFPVRYVVSPHLADPQQAKDFEMQVIEDETKAGA